MALSLTSGIECHHAHGRHKVTDTGAMPGAATELLRWPAASHMRINHTGYSICSSTLRSRRVVGGLGELYTDDSHPLFHHLGIYEAIGQLLNQWTTCFVMSTHAQSETSAPTTMIATANSAAGHELCHVIYTPGVPHCLRALAYRQHIKMGVAT